MNRTLVCISLMATSLVLAAQTHHRDQGTIVRMNMTPCDPQHGFMAAMSGGAAKTDNGMLCPEYVLVSEQVVYVISGKASEPLLPLADITRFRFQKNEMLIRVDDAQKESHFHIKAMALRPDWERSQQIEEAAANEMIRRHLDPATMRERQ